MRSANPRSRFGWRLPPAGTLAADISLAASHVVHSPFLNLGQAVSCGKSDPQAIFGPFAPMPALLRGPLGVGSRPRLGRRMPGASAPSRVPCPASNRSGPGGHPRPTGPALFASACAEPSQSRRRFLSAWLCGASHRGLLCARRPPARLHALPLAASNRKALAAVSRTGDGLCGWNRGWRGQREASCEAASVGPQIARDGRERRDFARKA